MPLCRVFTCEPPQTGPFSERSVRQAIADRSTESPAVQPIGGLAGRTIRVYAPGGVRQPASGTAPRAAGCSRRRWLRRLHVPLMLLLNPKPRNLSLLQTHRGLRVVATDRTDETGRCEEDQDRKHDKEPTRHPF